MTFDRGEREKENMKKTRRGSSANISKLKLSTFKVDFARIIFEMLVIVTKLLPRLK